MRVSHNPMQNNHRLQQVYTEKAFKIMSSLFFSNLKLQFSDRHNSLYGYGDFLARLFEMCRHCQYAETAYNSRFIKGAKSLRKRIPRGKWMLGVIKQVRYDYMLTRCLGMAGRTVMMIKRYGMLRMLIWTPLFGTAFCILFRMILSLIYFSPPI